MSLLSFRHLAAAAALFCAASACAAPPRFITGSKPAPFSEAVQVGEVLYLSGQIGNRANNTLPAGVEAQARQAMDNIAAIMARQGGSMDDVFKCTVMLADIGDWKAFNAVYVTYFKPDRLPARSAFATNGLVAGALFEVECMAHRAAR